MIPFLDQLPPSPPPGRAPSRFRHGWRTFSWLPATQGGGVYGQMGWEREQLGGEGGHRRAPYHGKKGSISLWESVEPYVVSPDFHSFTFPLAPLPLVPSRPVAPPLENKIPTVDVGLFLAPLHYGCQTSFGRSPPLPHVSPWATLLLWVPVSFGKFSPMTPYSGEKPCLFDRGTGSIQAARLPGIEAGCEESNDELTFVDAADVTNVQTRRRGARVVMCPPACKAETCRQPHMC